MAQLPLNLFGKRVTIGGETCEVAPKLFDAFDLAGRCAVEVLLKCVEAPHRGPGPIFDQRHALGKSLTGEASLVEQGMDFAGAVLDGSQPLFGSFHRLRQCVGALFGAGLDQFEESHAGIGEAGNVLIGPVECFPAAAKLSDKGIDPASQCLARLMALRGDGLESVSERGDALAQFIALFGQGFELHTLRLPPFGKGFVKRRHALFQGHRRFVLRGRQLGGAALCFGLENAIALGNLGVDPGRFVEEGLELGVCRFERGFVDLLDLSHGLFEPGLHRIDLSGPGPDGCILALANGDCDAGSLFPERLDAGLHGRQRLGFLLASRRMGLGQFAAQSHAPRPEARQRFNFLRLQVVADSVTALGQSGKALGHDGLKLGCLVGEGGERFVHTLAKRGDLSFAGLAKLIQTFEARNKRPELVLRRASDTADLVRHIAGGVGDDREIVAQLLHIFERCGAGAGDGIDLFAIVADKPLQPVGVLGNFFRCAASQIF